MGKNTLIILVIILAVIISATAVFSQLKPQPSPGDKSTKLAITNNGQTWLHFDLSIMNAPMKDGSRQPMYIEVFMKPGGTATIDLSNLLGYDNTPLPVGTEFRIITWAALYNPKAGGTGNIESIWQGWSKTPTAPSNTPKFAYSYAGAPIAALPPNINDNAVFATTNADEARTLDNDADEPIFCELLLTVDSNGFVRLTPIRPPILCTSMAEHPV